MKKIAEETEKRGLTPILDISESYCRMSIGLTKNNKIGVIFTCITGKYDELGNHVHEDARWDYVCFTDDQAIKAAGNSAWQIRPLVFDRLDNIRNQRWHKLHPHILFPEYEKSVWLDGNLNVLHQDFFADIDRAINEDRLMSIAPHPERNCLYDEMQACIEVGKDNALVMRKQIELIRQSGFPQKHGLFENNIIFRQHNNPKLIKVMADWWWWIENHSRRDQLSLTYILWKQGMNVEPLAGTTYRNGSKVAFVYGKNHVTPEELIVQAERHRIRKATWWASWWPSWMRRRR
jgi:hypothetical protein